MDVLGGEFFRIFQQELFYFLEKPKDFWGWTLPYLIAVFAVLGIEMLFVKRSNTTLGLFLSNPSTSMKQDFLFFLLSAFQIHRLIGFLLSFGIGHYIFHVMNSSLGWQGLLQIEHLALKSLCYLIAMDFTGYWYHRSMHGIPCLWSIHRFHHATTDLSPFSTYRIHPLELAYRFLFFALPVAVIGPYAEAYAISTFIQLFSGVFVHSRFQYSFGWLGTYVFNSSFMHSNHHRRSMKDQTSNFGFFFIFWDWIFGTAKVPSKTPDYHHGDEHLSGHLPLLTSLRLTTTEMIGILRGKRSTDL